VRPPGPPVREPWLGERPLKGRSILLRQEQGFGDMIQFARYIPRVTALGARVHVEVPRPLARLFQLSFPGVEEVHEAGSPLPGCDESCPITSLALAFSTELASIPSAVPYLRAPERPASVRAALDGHPEVPRIGIAWSGDPKHHNDSNRSIPFGRFRAIVDGSGLPFVCLQREIRRADQEALGSCPSVASLQGRMRDFADTAALVEELDLVVSVDTSIAHLAGALGKETWTLLPFSPDWRWMMGRADSPWYPTMRLFRQPDPGDWEGVFREVVSALAARFPGRRRPQPARR
jgi:Glycosyltransferase family 9 (heptosyltransferase)